MEKKDQIKLSSNIAVIAGVVAILVSILLLLNYWQISSNEPLETEAMKVLVEEFSEDADNEQLRQEIRNLDLLARKAYFNSIWQINTGAYILLISAILLILSLRIYYALISKIEKPELSKLNDSLNRLISQKWILGIGSGVIVLALISALLTTNRFEKYEPTKRVANVQEETEIEKIEVIDMTEDATFAETDTQDIIAEVEVLETQEVSETKNGFKPDNTNVSPGNLVEIENIKKNYNAFRGPFGNGVSYHKNIPTDWNVTNGTNILWKATIPIHGYNSPIIWGDKLFIAGGNQTERVVYCFDRHSGKLLWTHKADNIPGSPARPPKTTDDTGLSASTTTTDGKRVYAIFGTGDILAVDMNGKRVWGKNLGVPDNHYGHSSSLIVFNNKLFVQYDTNKGSKLYALNPANGASIWEKVRNTNISWASPIIADINGKYQIILSSEPIVAGYDIENGEELWKVDCMMGEVGPSPAFGDGLIYAANEYAILVAIDPANSYQVAWENDEYLPEVASPVVSDGLLFIATSYGVLVCYDAKTGEQYWETEYSDGFYSSPVIADGKLYIFEMNGKGHVFEVSKELKVLGNPAMGEDVFATPAFADGKIYVRGKNHLYCIGTK